MAANKIDSFAVNHSESHIYAGTTSGELLRIRVEDFEVESRRRLHDGSIGAIALHPTLDFVATLGLDGRVSIVDISTPGREEIVCTIPSREIAPPDDEYERSYSGTQALCFHPTEMRLAGHGGTAGLFEVDFSPEAWSIRHCSRLHDDHDFITCRYVDRTGRLLSGSNRGAVVLSESGKEIRRWDLGATNDNQSIHWFEEVSPGVFYVASDAQRIFRLDVETGAVVEGPIVARDHLEHVTYCNASQKLYSAGFDRNVYGHSLENCSVLEQVWVAPFKLRWIKALEANPDLLVVNCRNGGLYLVSVSLKQPVALIKETPSAIWTSCVAKDSIWFAGEGNVLHSIRKSGVSRRLRKQEFEYARTELCADPYYFSKRITHFDGKFYLSRSDGQILAHRGNITEPLCRLPQAVRDVSIDEGRKQLYAACEDGCVYRISLTRPIEGPEVIFASPVPVWAIDYNSAGDEIAFALRMNQAWLYAPSTGELKMVGSGTRFNKRLRWVSPSAFVIGTSDGLYRYDRTTRDFEQITVSYYDTIEDFDWDEDRRYIVAISYSRKVLLVDFKSGEVIDSCFSGMDYMKGVRFLKGNDSDSDYRRDFLVYGRDGIPLQYRVFESGLMSLGPVWPDGTETHIAVSPPH